MLGALFIVYVYVWRGGDNIKTKLKINKQCFTLIIIAVVLAVIMLVPGAAFAEDAAADSGDSDNAITSSSTDSDTGSSTDFSTSSSQTSSTESSFTVESDSNDSITTSSETTGSEISNDSDFTVSDDQVSSSETSSVTETDTDTSIDNLPSQDPTDSAESSPLETSSQITSDDENVTTELVEDESIVADSDEQTTAGQEGNSYDVELTLDGVVAGTGGEVKEFTVTYTELSDTTLLGSTQLIIPEGFTADSFDPETGISVSTTDGSTKNWYGELLDNNLYLWALDEFSYLSEGESVSATFTATTPTSDSGDQAYVFQTLAWTEASADYKWVAADESKRNYLADGYSDPVVYVQFPVETADGKYSIENNLVEGLTVEIEAEGSGFDICVFTIDRTVTSIIQLETPGRDPILVDLSEWWWIEPDSSLWDLADENGFVWLYYDQVWIAQITINDGSSGILQQFVQGSYIPGVEDYIGITQRMSTNIGTIWRFIDISSPDSGAYLYEDMRVYDMKTSISETLTFVILEPLGGVAWKPWPFDDPFEKPTKDSDHYFNYQFESTTLPFTDKTYNAQSILNQAMSALQILVSRNFIANGTQEDLMAAKLAYWRALYLFETYGDSLSADQKAAIETELAVVWAAILALEASLQAKAGEPFDLEALIEAYSQAMSVLNANRAVLSSDLVTYASSVLAEVSKVINNLSALES